MNLALFPMRGIVKIGHSLRYADRGLDACTLKIEF